MVERRKMFRIVLRPDGFPNFSHNFCPALQLDNTRQNVC